jgi:hypothetical protein
MSIAAPDLPRRAMTNSRNALRQINPTGKSAKPCPAFYFPIFVILFGRGPQLVIYYGRPIPEEGRFANVTNVGVGCDGRSGVVTRLARGRAAR